MESPRLLPAQGAGGRRPQALVTGASSGIGRELARILARSGYDLVLVARNRAALDELARELRQRYSQESNPIEVDLAQPGAAQQLLAQLPTREFEVLVNVAGVGLRGPFSETDSAREIAMVHLNVIALTELTKLLLPGMLARRRGRILNVASAAAFLPGPFMAVYYATEAYVLSFSEALSEELRNSGVTVTALCPPPTQTDFAATAGATRTRVFASRAADPRWVAEVGFRGMMRGRAVVVPGLPTRLFVGLLRFLPRSMARRASRFLTSPPHP
jgi:uncharacterized protein